MRKQAGFSLVEISIVLVVVGLLMGSAINGLTVYLQNSRINAARQTLDSISRSITGFVIANGRFPCPDSGDLGQEDCGVNQGSLPYAVLGTDKYDPWNERYFYAVDPDYSDDPAGCAVTFKADDPTEAAIKIESMDGERTNIAAVVYSTGPDMAPQQDDPDGLIFRTSDPNNPFDDIVVSISSLIIKTDLTHAGRYPDEACP